MTHNHVWKREGEFVTNQENHSVYLEGKVEFYRDDFCKNPGLVQRIDESGKFTTLVDRCECGEYQKLKISGVRI